MDVVGTELDAQACPPAQFEVALPRTIHNEGFCVAEFDLGHPERACPILVRGEMPVPRGGDALNFHFALSQPPQFGFIPLYPRLDFQVQRTKAIPWTARPRDVSHGQFDRPA